MSFVSSSLIVAALLATILALTTHVNAHLCVYAPRQRGAFFNGDIAQNECFRPKVPCGGKAFDGNVAAEIDSSKPFKISFQQNLNHYSIGNTGYLSVSISRNTEPTQQSDFTPMAFVTDYYPVRQWVQTNYTLDVTIPRDFAQCDHCVIQVRYVSHKPEEPAAFHQCSDVRIVKSLGERPRVEQASSKKTVPRDVLEIRNNKPNASSNLFGLYESTDGQLQAVTVDPETANIALHTDLSKYTISDGRLISLTRPLNKMRISNGVTAVDTRNQRVYYLAYSDTDFQYPDAHPDLLIMIERSKPGVVNSFKLDNKIAVSSLTYVDSENALYAWSLDISTITWRLVKIQTNGEVDPKPIVSIPKDDIDSYVDFLYSAYDPDQHRMIMLTRHEDEGVDMPQRFYSVNLNDPQPYRQVQINSTKYYAWSEVFYDVKNHELLALSPGHAPALPITKTSQWSLVKISGETGAQEVVYSIDKPFCQMLNGTIANAVSSNDETYYKIVHEAQNRPAIVSVSTRSPRNHVSRVNPDLARVYNLVNFNQ